MGYLEDINLSLGNKLKSRFQRQGKTIRVSPHTDENYVEFQGVVYDVGFVEHGKKISLRIEISPKEIREKEQSSLEGHLRVVNSHIFLENRKYFSRGNPTISSNGESFNFEWPLNKISKNPRFYEEAMNLVDLIVNYSTRRN
jgi:hypothetical protein